MRVENIKKWMNVLLFALKGTKNNIVFNNYHFSFRVFELDKSKKGYVTIWNTETKHAFNISIKIDNSIKSEIIHLKKNYNYEVYGIPDDLIFNNSKPY